MAMELDIQAIKRKGGFDISNDININFVPVPKQVSFT